MKDYNHYASLGSPDRLADYVASYLIDRWIEHDSGVRADINVSVKLNVVNVFGEVSSNYEMPFDEIRGHVRDAICMVGYDLDYCREWGITNTVAGENMSVNVCLSRRVCPEGICAGVGFGVAMLDGLMGGRHVMLQKLCDRLCQMSHHGRGVGIDISTSLLGDDLTVVIPSLVGDDQTMELVREAVDGVTSDDLNVTIKTTRTHGPARSCGMSGRYRPVRIVGNNICQPIVSPFGMDGHSRSVWLNVLAEMVALDHLRQHGEDVRVFAFASPDGESAKVVVYGFDGVIRREWTERIFDAAETYGLMKPVFADMFAKCIF